jgi:hypothetical protein
MAKCSRCGAVETSLYINGVPVCLDCDDKSTSPSLPFGPRITESNEPPPPPPKKVQSIDGSRTEGSTIHIVGARRR